MGIDRWEIGYAGEFNTEPEMSLCVDGDYVSFADHEQVVDEWKRLAEEARDNALNAEAEATRLRAELAAKSKDAERWQYARRILPVLYIEDSHEKYVLWGRDDSEIENSAADRAIDSAMGEGNGR